MVKNYLKLAFRNFKRRKGHTFINILGLAIALACCLFIGLYVQYELSYDTFYPQGDRIYRVIQTSITPEKKIVDAVTPYPLGATLQSEYPRLIDKTVRLYNTGDDEHSFVIRGDSTTKPVLDSFIVKHFFFVDSTFLNVFDIKLIRGNPRTALKNPLSMVLTQEQAHRFFGDANPMGQTISFEGYKTMGLKVTGIMAPLPSNTHLKASVLASANSLNRYYTHPDEFKQNWFNANTWTYVLLKKEIQQEELTRQFSRFTQKYYAGVRDKNETLKLSLQPVKSIYLHSNIDDEMQPNGSIFYVYLFSTAALLLLIIACINFMNLATARASERSREVGMRKALGAGRAQLFWQFMGESFLLTFMAFVLAIIMVIFLTPLFNQLVGEHLAFNLLQNPLLLLGVITLFILVGIFAGAYPALYLSGFLPQHIFQGHSGKTGSKANLRSVLVVVQFAVSVVLIIGTMMVFLQLRHMQNKKLGFDKERIAIMPIKQNLIAWEYPDFKERAEQNAAILSVTGMGKILGSDETDSWKIAPAGKGGVQGENNFTLWVTHDFIKTFGLQIVAGRSFSKEHSTDASRSIIINEKMVKKLGYDDPHDALGALFYYTQKSGKKNPLQVIGVVKDFNYASIKKEIQPTVIVMADNQQYRLGSIYFTAAKLAPGRTKEGLAELGKIWADIDPIDPFSYTFQNDELKKIYAKENTTSSVMTVFTVLCIIVACLGLFGLASFTSSQRTKEIGIRKTLGASISGIVMLLSREYFKLVVIANIIAWPVIYYLATLWLQNFAYRIQMGWNMIILFAGVAVLSLLICLLTVSYQSVKAALINPVDSIRQE